MPTIQQLFPGLPGSSFLPYPCGATFSAPLTAGRFVFSKVRAPIHYLTSSEIGIVSDVSFVSNVDALQFSRAVDKSVNGGYFTLNIVGGGNGNPVNLAPFKFANFAQASGFVAQFAASAVENAREEFFLELDGALIQTPEIVAAGLVSVSLFASLNLFRTKNQGVYK